MNKTIIWIAVAVIIILVIYYAYVFMKKKAPSPIGAAPSGPSSGGAAQVIIEGFAFQPADLNVSKGMMVGWINNDSVTHIVVSDGNLFESPSMPPGGKFEFVFESTGEFPYHCSIHPSMTGKIIVE
jgi:plastocyanin